MLSADSIKKVYTEGEVTSPSLWSRYDRHFVGITRYSVGLNGEYLSRYSNKAESGSLRKCPYDDWLTSKEYLSAITVTNIYQSFYLQDYGKNKLASIWNKITSLSPYELIISLVHHRLCLDLLRLLYKCATSARSVEEIVTHPQLPLYSNFPWFSCIDRSDVWKLSATIWQPAFQNICRNSRDSVTNKATVM